MPLDLKVPITLITLADLPRTQDFLPPTKRTASDVACLIYTSGTTGNPKAYAIPNVMMNGASTSHSQDVSNPKTYFPNAHLLRPTALSWHLSFYRAVLRLRRRRVLLPGKEVLGLATLHGCD